MPSAFDDSGDDQHLSPHSKRGRNLLRLTLGSLLCALAFAPPIATAQVPGLDPSADPVISDAQNLVTIQVNTPNLANGTISGQIINKTSSAITCNGFPTNSQADAGNVRTPGVVATRSQIVADSLDYYAKFPYKTDPLVAVDAPVIGMVNVDLGSVTAMVPPLAANAIWPDVGARSNIGASVTDARIAGQLGTQSSISIPANNGTASYQVTLGRQSQGVRESFEAGVILACEIAGRKHVFGGFENGRRPGATGSLGQIFETGRFGS